MTAAASSIALLLTLAACSTTQPSSSDSGNAGKQSDAGTVTLFAPADGITMSQKTPLNKWAKLVPQITGELEDQGMTKSDIDTHISDGIDEQSQQLQDWVVKHINGLKDKEQTNRSTLIVAPASQTNISSRQYGDYVTQPSVSKDSQTSEQQEAESRMRSALQLAKKAGMHVVLVSNTVEGFTPDAFVQCSTPEQIGELQANMLVNKLDLGKVSKDNPKAVEVLLPYAGADDAETTENAEIDDTFAQEAFKGVWKILKPYYEQGRIYSPSGTLSKDSTDDDWKEVAFDLNQKDGVAKTLENRIPLVKKDGASVLTKIDGIIAMNDAVASSVVDKLGDMGYQGSSADINPSITIPSIVGNIAGHKDLLRKAVPEPSKSPDNDAKAQNDAADDSSATTQNSRNAHWPVITGYGSYADTIPQVVNGKQWMTGLEDRGKLSADIAKVCVRLNGGQGLDGVSYVSQQTINGTKVPTVHEDLMAVSAGNLKSTLIDPGYISMAEAGL
ncbi:substrate-binding domain-containing protein [Bifidobacterium pongonis]|uniref:substrate-binding domain-containing protein n=1 Tax=Bifidobacterium pongonis TaxID=2834432 RepID=UPI001F272E73|nr:substrate-binding domain-containing protein [Bifidobacterium pongonis]